MKTLLDDDREFFDMAKKLKHLTTRIQLGEWSTGERTVESNKRSGGLHHPQGTSASVICITILRQFRIFAGLLVAQGEFLFKQSASTLLLKNWGRILDRRRVHNIVKLT